MLFDFVMYLDSLLSDFGTIVWIAIAFWLLLVFGSLIGSANRVRRSRVPKSVVREFRLPSRAGRG